MANLEGTVGKHDRWPYSGYPQFNCPETILEALKDSGVDFLTLANNHIMDQGGEGFRSTRKILDACEIAHTGAGMTLSEAQKLSSHVLSKRTGLLPVHP